MKIRHLWKEREEKQKLSKEEPHTAIQIWQSQPNQWRSPKNTACQKGPRSVWGASLVAPLVKNLPAMQEAPVQFLGQEIPMDKR